MTDQEAKLYISLGLQSPSSFRADWLERREQLFENEEESLNDETILDFIRNKRRSGRTTTIIVKTIIHLLNNESVIIYTRWKAQADYIKTTIREYLEKIELKPNTKFKIINIETIPIEPHDDKVPYTYDFVYVDSPECFRS